MTTKQTKRDLISFFTEAADQLDRWARKDLSYNVNVLVIYNSLDQQQDDAARWLQAGSLPEFFLLRRRQTPTRTGSISSQLNS